MAPHLDPMSPVDSEANPPTLDAVLAEHARTRGDDLAMAFPSRAGGTIELSCRQLDARVSLAAGHFLGAGVRAAEAVAILARDPYEQALAFLGALRIGAHPTILSFPSAKQRESAFLSNLSSVLRASDSRWLACSTEFWDRGPGWARSAGGASCVSLRLLDVAELSAEGVGAHVGTSATTAPTFYQFSSGTTGTRKGVAITSRMLALHARSFAASIGLRAGDRLVSWTPLYHDGGLVRVFLSSLYVGACPIIIPPFAWLERPSVLLRAIDDYDAKFCYQPTFAYAYCASRIGEADISGVDLSRVRAFLFGAEPVRLRAVREFVERFAQHGVRVEQLQVGYGMAENTCAVAQTELGKPVVFDRIDRDSLQHDARAVPVPEGSAAAVTLASCGRPLRGVELRIAGGDVERIVGEIELRSPFSASEYMVASGVREPVPITADGWLRTGDVGYMAAGELFVCGRSKDIIIVNGANIYPEDIEEVASRAPGVRQGRVVAFGLDDEALGTERLIVAAELADEVADPAPIESGIRGAVSSELGVFVADVWVCPSGTLQKSTSGKLSRGRNRDLYIERARSAPRRSPVAVEATDHHTRELIRCWEAALRVSGLDAETKPSLAFGAGSLTAAHVASMMMDVLNGAQAPADVLRALLLGETIGQQAALIREIESERGQVFKWLRRGSDGFPPIVLIHASVGLEASYVTLARELDYPGSVIAARHPELCGVEPGAPIGTIKELAAYYVAELMALDLGPCLLGGWSFGGVVAFEMACLMTELERKPLGLLMLDSRPPRSWRPIARGRVIRAIGRLALGYPALGRRAPVASKLFHVKSIGRRFLVWLTMRGCDSVADVRGAARFCLPEDRELHARLEHMAYAEAWEELFRRFKETGLSEELARFVMPHLSAMATLNVAKLWVRNNLMLRVYSTRGVFDGPVLHVAGEESQYPDGWTDYFERPPDNRRFPIEGAPGFSPHFCMLDPGNTRLFAPAVSRFAEACGSRGVEGEPSGANARR
jgi:fatty-acyl-CoA synthase